MKNIVIIGAGDLGKELVWLIEDINKVRPTYVILGFLDDDLYKRDCHFYGYRVLGSVDQLLLLREKIPFSAVIAIRDGGVRKRIVQSFPEFNSWESIVHPTAVIASSCHVGKGSIFFPNVIVSVDSKLGEFGLYYIHSIICNDCQVGNYVSLMGGAIISEHTEVSDESILAIGTCVQPHTKYQNSLCKKIEK